MPILDSTSMCLPKPPIDLNSFAVWQSLLAAIIGGLLALAGTFAAKYWERRQECRALKAAFGAEIEAILTIAEIRKHLALAQMLVAAWKNGQDVLPKMYGKPPEVDLVYAKNVDKIGMLGKDAADVVLFYTKLAAVRTHLRAICEGHLSELEVPDRINFVQQAIDLWSDTKPEAEILVARLKAGV